MDGWTRRQAIIALVIGVAAIAIFAWLWSNRNRVEVLAIDRHEPDVLSIMVGSCNGAPAADVEELGDGRYEVEARTTQSYDSGDACGDIVEIPVDPERHSFEVVDRVSGDTFVWPPIPPTEPVEIDGTWEMVEVNGEPVHVGVNTAVVPRLHIDAGFAAGTFGCNRGGAELLQDGATMLPSPIESEAELCSIPDGSEVMVLTERTLLALFESGFGIERIAGRMTWSGDPGSVVFELDDE